MACSKSVVALAVSLVAATAYAIPPLTTLPGSTPLTRYGRSGDVAHPVPFSGLTMLQRGVTVDETLLSGVIGGVGVYVENPYPTTTIHPWAFYAETRTAHNAAGAVATYARLRNEGGGWATAAHAEAIATGSGTSIGSNVEVSPMASGTGRVVGIVVQAKAGYGGETSTRWTNEGLLLQSDPGVGFVDGVRLECATGNGIHFTSRSSSTRAIWIEGSHTVGLDVGASPIRMNVGTPIQLEATGQITIVFANGRIEFRNGATVLGYIANVSGGRMN